MTKTERRAVDDFRNRVTRAEARLTHALNGSVPLIRSVAVVEDCLDMLRDALHVFQHAEMRGFPEPPRPVAPKSVRHLRHDDR
jgi:hypothetical protein